MLVCQKCNKEFKTYIKIENKFKWLGNRKFCLECSPYLKKKSTIANTIIDRVCVSCGKEFKYKKNTGCGTSKCSACLTRDRRKAIKAKAIEYKGGKCSICEYNKCLHALEFHHMEPDKKEFQISVSNRSWIKMKIELDKCILVCANCHREIHANSIPTPGKVV